MSSSGGSPPAHPAFPGPKFPQEDVQIARDPYTDFVWSFAPNTIPTNGSYLWSPPIPVDSYSELLAVLSLTVAATGSPSNLTFCAQMIDSLIFNQQQSEDRAGIFLPGSANATASGQFAPLNNGSILVPTPANSIGPICGLMLTVFGHVLRFGVKADARWTNADAESVAVTLYTKG